MDLRCGEWETGDEYMVMRHPFQVSGPNAQCFGQMAEDKDKRKELGYQVD